MATHHHRIVRIFILLTAALLTVFFIYASYYSNLFMIPARMHSGVIVSQITGDDSTRYRSDNDVIVVVDKQSSERVISQNAAIENDVSNSSFVQQYIDVSVPYPSSSSSVVFQKNNNTINVTSRNGTISSAIGISTKYLNVTSSAASPISSQSSSNSNGSISPSKSQQSVDKSIPKNKTIGPIDPLKGVRTSDLYEGGHIDDTNTSLCPDEGDDLKLLILVTSAPTHRDARLAIRQTWGHYGVRRDIGVAFILGRTTNQAIEQQLTTENYLYGDIIRGQFIDSYNNLTLKTISALEWVDKNCPHVDFILKTDDDMFINVPKLISFIEKHRHDKRTIFGRLAKKWKPIRNKKSKYYVSPGQFSSSIFPQFTTGPAYLMTSDIIHDLYMKSLDETYLKLEDVFTTGIVAQLLNIKRLHVKEFLNRRIVFNICNIRKAISVHMVKSHEQFDLWKKLLDMTTKCK